MSTALAKLSGEAFRRFDSAISKFDSWQNRVTGFGTDRDKTTYSEFLPFTPLSDQVLSNLYHGDDIAQRIVDIVPQELYRKGFEVDVGKPEDTTALGEKLKTLGAREKFQEAERWGRLYGGAAVLIGADDGRPASTPLQPERARDVRYLYVIDRRLLWPLTWYGEHGHEKLGRPETYLVSPSFRAANGMQAVHESRLILFGGAETGQHERERLNGWDLSVLQRPYEIIRSFNTGWKAVEILLTDANQAVFKMSGLAEALASEEATTQVTKRRMEVMDLFRSVARAIVVDAGTESEGAEDFTRHSVSFDSIPQTLDKFMLRLAAAAKMPVTILMGQSPAGMNATGESDFRWFYDSIESEQNNDVAPKVRRLVDVILATRESPVKSKPASVTIKFPPLWSETPQQAATTRKILLEGDDIAIASGQLLPEEAALSRFRPEGFGSEIKLSDEARQVREDVLKSSLTGMIPEPDGDDVPPVNLAPTDIAAALKVNEVRASQGFGPLTLEDGSRDPDGTMSLAAYKTKLAAIGQAPAPGTELPEEVLERTDAADICDMLSAHPRCVIAGGPRTGKSTLAVRAGERYGRQVRYADSLVGSHEWSDASAEVATWLDDPGDWIVEGVATPRALRKWLAANPGKKLDATVVWLRKPIQVQSKGQQSMTRGVEAVWRAVKQELDKRGVTIIERDT
jgi:phage-related protein (TIGR01555 family)